MRLFPRRLGTKLNLSLFIFLLLLGGATAFVILFGFRNTQDNATKRSRDGLERESSRTLQVIAGTNAAFGQAQLEATAGLGEQAARYMLQAPSSIATTQWDPARLTRSSTGQTYDPDPNRVTSVMIPATVLVDARVQRDLQDSAVLDAIFPAILSGFSGDVRSSNFDADAVYFNSVNGVTRYFPAIPIEQFPASADPRNMVQVAGPALNPQRQTKWTAPYADETGGGSVITALIPIYDHDEYRGIIGLDVPLANLASQIDLLKPTPNGFGFYLDQRGSLFRTSSYETVQAALADANNTSFASAIAAMKAGQQGVVRAELGREQVFVGFAPVGGIGGSLAVVVPLSDVTQESELVASGIRDQGNRTTAFVIATMIAFFLAALLATAFISRRILLSPIAQLVAGTRAVASGDFGVTLPVRSADELGLLAESFNGMTTQLASSRLTLEQRNVELEAEVSERKRIADALSEARELLEQRVEERTRELAAMLDVSNKVAATLEVEPLLDMVLEQVQAVAPYDRGAFLLLEGDQLCVRAISVRDGVEVGHLREHLGLRLEAGPSPMWDTIASRTAYIIDDVRGGSAGARAYRAATGELFDTVFASIHSWMGVPVTVKDRVIGMLALTSDTPAFYQERHGALAKAIASQAAVGVENARLFEETQTQARELGALLEVAENVGSTLETHPLLQLVLEQVQTVLPYDRAAIMIREGDELVSMAALAAPGLDLHPGQIGMRGPIENDSVAWGLMMQGKPAIADDISDDSPISREYRERNAPVLERALRTVGSFMAVPIMRSNEPIGMMIFTRTEVRSYNARHAEVAAAIGRQAAVAIENARLFGETQRSARELEGLLDVTRATASTLDLGRVAGVILEKMKGVLDYTNAALSIVQNDEFVVLESRGTIPEDWAKKMTVDVAVTRHAQETGMASAGDEVTHDADGNPVIRYQIAIVGDVWDESPGSVAFRGAMEHAATGAGVSLDPIRGVHSYMGIPVIAQDRLVGLLSLHHEERHFYNAQLARLGRAIADQAALAIENARLFEETRRRARESEALFQADERLFRTLNMDAVFQALVDVMVDVLDVDKCMVTTIIDSEGRYVVRASRNMAQSSLDLMMKIRQDKPRRELATITGPIVNEDARKAIPDMVRVFEAEGIRSTMDIPILSAGGTRAAFSVAYTTPHRYTADEERLFQALAERAEVALDNAELFEKSQQVASLEERQRLARELHDSVSQALYGIALGARTARTLLDRDPARAVEPVDYVLQLAEAGLAEMRALIFELRPESLEMEGLVAAIGKHVAATQGRYGIAVESDMCDEPVAPLEAKEAIYRIAQEALHNVVKHARAEHVRVRLSCDATHVALTIRDDGAGFDPDGDFPGHMGLRSMRERTAKVGGTMTIESAPGDGTTISARVSFPAMQSLP